jgi:diguanylate cyclase (GGDEF)-like protein
LEKQKINVLIAENNPDNSLFWEKLIAEIHDTDIEFVHIENLSDILKYLEKESPDVILLDLSEPKGGGFEVFLLVYNKTPVIPIIVVTGTLNQKLALQTALEGAQDSLVKSDLNGYLLSRSMRYAIGRQKHLKQERAVSVIDELTGLYNRRGFLIHADEQIKTSDQSKIPLLLVYADMDGLKTINDTLGHYSGDLALMETAHVLREAFRETDLLGRLGGDEFVALLACEGDITEASLMKRFQDSVDEHNSYHERTFKLSASIGIARYDPLAPLSSENLLSKADAAMYQQKNHKKDSNDLGVVTGMRDPVRSILTETLADTRNEAIVQLMIPILRKCGVDSGLSLQLSSWVSKGSRELKLKLLEMFGEIGGVSGGPSLRMALFDDSEEVAALAARVVGKIHYSPGLAVLLKVAKIWQTKSPESERFLTAVCEALGNLGQAEGISFLQDIAGNRTHPGEKEYSLALKWAALQGLASINRPDTLNFLKSLSGEKDPLWRENLEKMTQDLRSTTPPPVPVGEKKVEKTRTPGPSTVTVPEGEVFPLSSDEKPGPVNSPSSLSGIELSSVNDS